jgi:hypothetical protein
LEQKERNTPEPPARVARLAAPVAAIDLAIKPLDAVVVAQVEARVRVLVLDLELGGAEVGVFGLGTHALGLAGGEVAGEHAAVASAGEVDPGLGFLVVLAPAPGEAARAGDFGVDGDEGGEGDGGGDLHGGRGVFSFEGWFVECFQGRGWKMLVVRWWCFPGGRRL